VLVVIWAWACFWLYFSKLIFDPTKVIILALLFYWPYKLLCCYSSHYKFSRLTLITLQFPLQGLRLATASLVFSAGQMRWRDSIWNLAKRYIIVVIKKKLLILIWVFYFVMPFALFCFFQSRDAEAIDFFGSGSATKKSTASASIFFLNNWNQIEQLFYRQLYLQKITLKILFTICLITLVASFQDI